ICSPSLLPFSLTAPPPPEIYTLSLHDALPISGRRLAGRRPPAAAATPLDRRRRSTGGVRLPAQCVQSRHHRRRDQRARERRVGRSEEHTSELQSPDHLVCRLLLEKKKICLHRI